MPAAAQRTIEMIEAEIGMARESYSAAISHSTVMDAAEDAAYSAWIAAFRAVRLAESEYSAGLNAANLAESEVDQTAEVLQTLNAELAALRDR